MSDLDPKQEESLVPRPIDKPPLPRVERAPEWEEPGEPEEEGTDEPEPRE